MSPRPSLAAVGRQLGPGGLPSFHPQSRVRVRRIGVPAGDAPVPSDGPPETKTLALPL